MGKHIDYFLATVNDTDAVIKCRIDFLVDLFGPQPQEKTDALKKDMAAYLHTALETKSYICCLARDGKDIVGAGGITVRQNPGNFNNPSGRVGYVMSMYTNPGYRRMGICSTILDRLMAAAKESGIHSFELHATKSGEPIYQKHGFTLHPEPTYRKKD